MELSLRIFLSLWLTHLHSYLLRHSCTLNSDSRTTNFTKFVNPGKSFTLNVVNSFSDLQKPILVRFTLVSEVSWWYWVTALFILIIELVVCIPKIFKWSAGYLRCFTEYCLLTETFLFLSAFLKDHSLLVCKCLMAISLKTEINDNGYKTNVWTKIDCSCQQIIFLNKCLKKYLWASCWLDLYED